MRYNIMIWSLPKLLFGWLLFKYYWYMYMILAYSHSKLMLVYTLYKLSQFAC